MRSTPHLASLLAGALAALSVSCKPEAPPPPTALAQESARLARSIDPRCFTLPLEPVTEPVLLEGDEVAYPLAAIVAGAEGRIFADCTITAEGRVDECAVTRSEVPAANDAVVDALRSRLYCPATADAWPVAVRRSFTFRFRLSDDATARR